MLFEPFIMNVSLPEPDAIEVLSAFILYVLSPCRSVIWALLFIVLFISYVSFP